VAIAVMCILRVVRVVRRLDHEVVAAGEVAAARKRVLGLASITAWLSGWGWLPGGFIFPLWLHLAAGPLDPAVSVHFMISFAVSGLISLTYSVLAVRYWSIRVLYPELWADGTGAARALADELGPVERRLGRIQVLAGLIPLAGAALMVGVGPDEQFTRSYRLLIAGLIGLGMAGFWLTVLVCDRLRDVLEALRGRPAGSEPDDRRTAR
jgi:hypothetical protein